MAEAAGRDWFLGLDLGTGSCKALAVDETARILGFGSAEYGLAGQEEKWQEQNPESLIKGLILAVREAVGRAGVSPGRCAGLSLGGAMHSLLVLDGSGRPLTGVSTWADGRASGQADAVRASGLGRELHGRTGCVPHGMYPLYKILWLRESRPEVFAQARRFVSAKEYVVARLTGEYLVDYSIASGSGLLDIHDLTWHGPALDLAGIGAAELSPIGHPLQVLKGLKADLAEEMGLSPSTPLILGSSDAANSSLGAGAVFPGQLTCMVGTSGALRLMSPRPVLDQEGRCWCYAVDAAHWIAGGAINNGGVALSWFRDLLDQPFQGRPEEARTSFDDLLALAGKVPAGAEGVICLPFLAGERSPNWNLNARAAFVGLRLHHGVEHLARAILEGVGFRLRSVLEILAGISDEVGEARASGGFTHSPLWLQIVASVLDRELAVPEWGETSSLGAAFWALLGTGALTSLDQAAGLVRLRETYRPRADEARTYDRLFGIYGRIYEALRPVFDQIASNI